MKSLLFALLLTKTDGGMNRVAKVTVEPSPLGRVVDIACEGEPVFTVFRLADPVRVVIDIARGDVSKLDGPIEVSDGVIGDIATAQFADDRHALGRLIIGLDKAFDYEVKQAGKHIRVTVRSGAPAGVPLVRSGPVTPTKEAAKLAAAKLEADKAATRKAESEALAKREAEKAAAIKAEADRNAASKAEKEKIAAEAAARKAESERVAKLDAERAELAKAQAEKAKIEAEKAALTRATVKPAQVAIAAKGPELSQVRAQAAHEVDVHEQKSQVVVDKTLEKIAVHKRKLGSDVFIKIVGGKPAYEVLELEDPPRVVFDLIGVRTTLPKHSQWSLGDVGRMRLGIHEDKVRLVLDGSSGVPKYDLKFDERGITIATDVVPAKAEPAPMLVAKAPEAAKPTPVVKAPETAPAAVAPPAPLSVAAPARTAAVAPATYDFAKKGDVARLSLVVPASASYELDRSIERAPQLIVQNAELPKSLEKANDVSNLGTAVTRLTSFNERGGKGLRVVANLNDAVAHKVYREGGNLVWEFAAAQPKPVALAPVAPERPVEVSMKPVPEVAGFSAEAAQLMRTTTTAQSSSRRINIDVRGGDLLNVLRLISDVSGENIVAGDDVTGKITLRLRNVPWENALDAALKTKGYGRVRSGSIIRVAPLDKLQKEKEAELARQKADEQIAPTFVRLIPLNYAQAKDINEQLKQLSTKERGKTSVDERTNTIVAEDLAEVLNKMEGLARRLDTQTPQVLIESRIVEANTQHVRDIGIQWGGSGLFSPATGNPTGLAFPNLVGFQGGADSPGTNTNGTADPGRFAVNLPAPVAQGSGGAFGLVFGNAANTGLLSLRLSALENNGSVRIVSAPKVTTLDNVRARISQGVSIPISVTSAAGVNTRFVDAFLELEVKPHVTQDGSIMMEIKATKNEPNFARTGAQGDPTIEKKVAETQVLVKDGDTTVIGGIYTRNTSTQYNEIPFVSKIPVLGWLFKRKRTEDNRAELLVFITPRIVNRQQSSIVAGGGL